MQSLYGTQNAFLIWFSGQLSLLVLIAIVAAAGFAAIAVIMIFTVVFWRRYCLLSNYTCHFKDVIYKDNILE